MPPLLMNAICACYRLEVLCAVWLYSYESYAALLATLQYMACDIILSLVQASVGLALQAHVPPDYPYKTQRDCMLAPMQQQSNSTTPAAELCSEYMLSERYARMAMVWRSYNFLTLENPSFYNRLSGIQIIGKCCGYGPPLGCMNDTRALPSAPMRRNITYYSPVRYACSKTAPAW